MRPLRPALALGCLAAVALTAACGSGGPEVRVARADPAPVRAADPRTAARADTAFGLDLLAAWCAQDPAANLVLSPSSIAGGLGMAYLGARGATAKAMAAGLHLPDGDPLPALHARAQALATLNGEKTTVRTTDQVWSDLALPPDGGYLSRVATGYGAVLKRLDIQGDPDGARRAVNEAIETSTAGQIPDLLPQGSVTRDTGWLLTDAVYLKARWADEFKRSHTSPARFTTAAGQAVRTPTMSREASFGYAHVQGWTAVDLPYAGGRLSMTALMPDPAATPGSAATSGCPRLDASTLGRVTGALRPARVDLALPKVRLRSRQNLRPLLSGLGMGVMFSGGADFTGISPKAARVAFVQHAATLLVDEKGTEAAAATATGVQAGAAPPRAALEVAFDRPHLLLVRDTRTGEPLFLARVADPSRT
ncbi:serpin family protein [Spirillospora sp. NBC_01491]|uniref:serpin family protein n=1 Tax=Spirillospora sp. NBC_01491 TaxID=2976007 RepID=UPI002E35BADC|nr:serpin family protein [Spirillospora sp. NBC_01491]